MKLSEDQKNALTKAEQTKKVVIARHKILPLHRWINLTMKLTIRAAGIFLLLLAAACDKDTVITSSIDGRWSGTRAELRVKPFGLPIPISKDYPSFDAEIEFRPDRTLAVLENGQSKEGTYSLNGDRLNIQVDFKIESYDLSGDYTIETLTGSSLVLYLERKDVTLADPDGAPTVKGQVKITLYFERL
jgi:hypothetical protein